MTGARVLLAGTLAMLAFAGNSLLCRMALKHTTIDAATFTSVRLVSAAVAMGAILALRGQFRNCGGNWLSALALFAYAGFFSFAYVGLSAAVGALLLFASVQVSMISAGILTGDRPSLTQAAGLALALAGFVWLLLPGLAAPPLAASVQMIIAGIAWGAYSLRGRGSGDPLRETAGNFLRTVPMTLALSALWAGQMSLDTSGLLYAVLSGALTSGVGYAIWYWVLPELRAIQASTMQLSVPVIAAFGGVALLGEDLSLRLIIAALAILAGIAIVILDKQRVA